MEGALRVMFMLPSRPGALAGWAALVFVVLLWLTLFCQPFKSSLVRLLRLVKR